MSSESIAIVIAAVAAMALWVAVLALVIRQIVRETRESPLSRVLWVLVVVSMPIVGPLIWAFVRWQVPLYGSLLQKVG